VAVSGVVVGGVALVLGVWSLTQHHRRTVSYTVQGSLAGIELDLGDADLDVVGAGSRGQVAIEHVDDYGFDHDATVRRSVDAGVFRVRSRCPVTVLHGCSVRYRVAVPDNLPLTINTTTGSVRMNGYRGSAWITTGDGDIDVDGFCGFLLQARAEGRGHVAASTACAPPQLTLRSRTGAVHALVPAGRYRVEATTAGGRAVVRGIQSAAEAPFSIQALSSSGSVLVERRP
jgi:hypothetical protein